MCNNQNQQNNRSSNQRNNQQNNQNQQNSVRADSSRDRTAVRISSRTSRTISIRTDADIFFSKGIRNTCSKGITYALFIPL